MTQTGGTSRIGLGRARSIGDGPTTSSTLIRSLQGSDGGLGWARFVQHYEGHLFRLAKNRGLDDHLAWDVVAEVYLRLVKHIPQFVYNPQLRFRAWLRTMLDRIVIDAYRTKKRERTISFSCCDPGIDPVSPVQLEDEDCWLEPIARRIEDANALIAKVRGRVQDKTWQAFLRTEVDQVPGVEVARELGLSEGAVYLARFRVRSMILDERSKLPGHERVE